MNPRTFFTTCLTLLLCLFMTDATAQCTKSRTSAKSASEKAAQNNKSACTKSKISCSEYRYACTRNKEEEKPVLNFTNTLLVLGAATIDPSNNNTAIATGLEYGRQITPVIGVGALAEMRINSEQDLSLRVGIPANFRVAQRLQLSASPLMAFQRNEVSVITGGTFEEPETGLVNEWSNNFGARAGVSYLLNINHLIIAPTVKVDYLGDQLEPTVGINVGFGF